MFGRNKVPFIIAGVLIVAFAIGGVVVGKSQEKTPSAKPPPESARAAVLPANQARTLIVPACNTPVEQTSSLAEKGEVAPGATVVELPKGGGTRYAMVPHCQETGQGVTNYPGNVPSAAFVLAEGQRPVEGKGGTFTADTAVARTQLILPNGSTATTIVVPPCTKKTAGARDVVLGGESTDAKTVTAPSC